MSYASLVAHPFIQMVWITPRPDIEKCSLEGEYKKQQFRLFAFTLLFIEKFHLRHCERHSTS